MSTIDTAVFDSVFRLVGNTPCVRLRGEPGPPLYLKLEGANPSGSIKDRACAFMLHAAVRDGALTPGKVLLDASSGNFACALALYGRVLGYDAAVAVSSKLTRAKHDFLAYLGATIHQVGDFTIQGNEFCRKLAASNPEKYHFVDQLHNWNNPQAHVETTGPELLGQVSDLATVVGSLGSGGTMAGVAAYLKSVAPHVRIVAVECAAGNRIPGTGTFVDGDYRTPFIERAYAEGHFDRTVRVTESDAARMSRRLVEQGLYCGLQTGGVVHAALNCADLATDGSIVVLSGDSGWKNLDKLLAL
jgi:cysteine synthase